MGGEEEEVEEGVEEGVQDTPPVCILTLPWSRFSLAVIAC